MVEVKNDYIEKALNELIAILGTKEFINHEKLYPLVHAKKFEECIKEIALYLGLPIEVNLSFVPKGYRPSYSNDGFQSTHLVNTDGKGRAGEGIEGITAQVSIPSCLPSYGSPSMINFPINVRISENCTDIGATFIVVMAHELSHIVLHSLQHREKDNELYTDITAMLLGFADIMKIGRRETNTDVIARGDTTVVRYHTTSYGYLSDENFNFAFYKIEDILNSQISAKKIFSIKLEQCRNKLNKTKKLSLYFKNCLEYLDANSNQNISQEDCRKISTFHQLGYTDDFKSIVNRNEIYLEKISGFVQSLNNYTDRNTEIMEQYADQLKSVSEELEKQYVFLQKDINVLKKYVSLLFKIKLKFA